MASDTRLIEAAQQGDLAAAEAALNDGADVNGRDQFGQTVLCWAIFNRRPEVVKLLLARGADPSLKGSMVRPVTAAASQGLIEIVRELLARNAEIDDNAATLARINDHADIVALLDAEVARRTAAAEAETEQAVPAIFAAAEAGDIAAIEEALAQGENPDAADADGWTPLMHAARGGHLAAVAALLKKEAKPNVGALLAACDGGNAGVIDALLAAGLDVNAAFQPGGTTALMLAARAGKADLVSLLLAKRADPNLANDAGVTPLNLAAREGNLAIVALLADKGADVDAPEKFGSTALVNASGGGFAALVAELLRRGAKIGVVERQTGSNAILAAAIGGNAEVIGILLGAGLDPNSRNEDGFTPLVYCASRGDVDSMRVLLANAAEPDAANNFGETALLRASGAGATEAVALLLDAGADIDHLSNERFTALMLAADQGHVAVAKLLVERGANRDLSSLALKKAYDYARIAAHSEVEELLKPPARPIPKVTRPATVSVEATRALMDSVWSNDLAAAVAALEAGAAIDTTGDDVPIVAAAHAGATDIVRLLLENGAAVDAADVTGLTALCKACGGSQVEMARALLEKGAKITSDVMMCASINRHPGIMTLLEAAAVRS